MNFFMPQRFAGAPTGRSPFMPQMPFGAPRPQAPVQFGGGFNPGQSFAPMRPQAPMQMPVNFGPGGGGGGMPLRSLASYKYGTPYVPNTGPAMLHEGEMVIPAAKAKKMRKVPLSSLMRLK